VGQPHADRALARRIECSVVRDLERYGAACARLDSSLSVASAHLAGGLALFVAPGSPVNMVFGAGLDGPVAGAEVESMEAFYGKRGELAAISLSPLADETLVAALGLRGWVLADFESVLVRRLGPDAPRLPDVLADITIATAESTEQRRAWGRLSAGAFEAPQEPSPEVLRLGEAMAVRDDSTLLVGVVGGEDAGAGALWVDGELGWLLGDATLPHLRGRGVQSALLSARCALAEAAGCTLAVTEARPGSTSQRNMERLGFSVVYTRVEMISPPRS
jgi:GNAT superfamily N-acetyltransferase